MSDQGAGGEGSFGEVEVVHPSANDNPLAESGWLSPERLGSARDSVPMVYVNAVPVRVNTAGEVVEVGLLLRMLPDGSMSRAVVSGRVLYGERVRDALLRHLAKDLGADAEPRLPASIAPFTVVEYFPDREVTGFHDPRQHAISLAYVVPVGGPCSPAQDALDLAWITPEEAISVATGGEMANGQGRLIRMALAHAAAPIWRSSTAPHCCRRARTASRSGRAPRSRSPMVGSHASTPTPPRPPPHSR